MRTDERESPVSVLQGVQINHAVKSRGDPSKRRRQTEVLLFKTTTTDGGPYKPGFEDGGPYKPTDLGARGELGALGQHLTRASVGSTKRGHHQTHGEPVGTDGQHQTH
jgi:hypothetical protein